MGQSFHMNAWQDGVTTGNDGGIMARKKLSDAELLKAQAEALLHEQQQVLAHAGSVVRQASRELGRFTSDEVFPRVVSGTRSAAKSTRDKLVDEVLPSVASVIGSTMSVIDAARDQRVRQLTKSVAAIAKSRKASAPVAAASAGAGKYIAIGIGVAALLGVGYVVWQTFRADDELWVAEDDAFSDE
jgi:hypothetical protein